MATQANAVASLKRKVNDREENADNQELETDRPNKKNKVDVLFAYSEDRQELVFTGTKVRITLRCRVLMEWLFQELITINTALAQTQKALVVPGAQSMQDLMANKLPMSTFNIHDAASATDFIRQFLSSTTMAQYTLTFSFRKDADTKATSSVIIRAAVTHGGVDIHVDPVSGIEKITHLGSYKALLEGLKALYVTYQDYFGQARCVVEAKACRDLMRLLKAKPLEFMTGWLDSSIELFVRVLAVLVVAEPIRCSLNLPLGMMALYMIKHQVKTSDTLFAEKGFWPAAHGGSKGEFIEIEAHFANGAVLSTAATRTLQGMYSVLGLYVANTLTTTKKDVPTDGIANADQLAQVCKDILKRKVLDHIRNRAASTITVGDINNAVLNPM
jgi:hypothetical protein